MESVTETLAELEQMSPLDRIAHLEALEVSLRAELDRQDGSERSKSSQVGADSKDSEE